MNELAEKLDGTVQQMWEMRAQGLYEDIDQLSATYVSIDVCHDLERLPKIVESIYLDRKFHYQKSWSHKRNKTFSSSKIIKIYSEGPPEMINYLTASFQEDIRYTGMYVSYNSSVDQEKFETYATILHFIITERLKWESLLVLNVRSQASIMAPVYQLLTQKASESKLCVQFEEIGKSWKINDEDNFTVKWFIENRPAVTTIGDPYGQVEVIKQLAQIMEDHNITIPILAEGFNQAIYSVNDAPENFDCFKDISSSFLTTQLDQFNTISNLGSDDEYFQKISISLSIRHFLLFRNTFYMIPWIGIRLLRIFMRGVTALLTMTV